MQVPVGPNRRTGKVVGVFKTQLEGAVGRRWRTRTADASVTMPKTFTISVDDRMDGVLDELKADFGKPSKAEVIRLAVTLLKVASDARKANRKIAVTSEDGRVQETILLPA